jgi:AraC-like DNA-binding protein
MRHRTVTPKHRVATAEPHHGGHEPPRGTWAVTFAREYPRRSDISEHEHGSDQLIYATRGVMEVTSGQKLWMIPPYFGLWVPARTVHRIRMPESVSMRTLYLRRGLAGLPGTCCVLNVRPLLRELIVEIVHRGELRTKDRVHEALCRLLIAELTGASSVATTVSLPKDPRAMAIARQLVRNPGLRMSLSTLCASAGVGVRTLERLFRKETGLDFESWRRQLRLMRAVEMLIGGCSVKEVAFAVGYRRPSAFVAAFRSVHGATPKRWMLLLTKK